MEFYAAWPFLVCMVALLAVASTPLLAAADTPPGRRGHRLAALDGLRGFLALAVLFHHGAFYHHFLAAWDWQLPPSRFYVVLGQAAVALFFMITGYLFWSRLIAEGGRPGWRKLYAGRLFRVGPLYLAAICVMLGIVFNTTGWHLAVTGEVLAVQLASWVPLGAAHGLDVNGYAGTTLLLAGVTWTLRYEWTFYAMLPLLAPFAQDKRSHLMFAAGGLLVCLVLSAWYPGSLAIPSKQISASLFFAGMTCASLPALPIRTRLAATFSSIAVAALLGAALSVCETAYAASSVVILGCAFYLVASGCTVFGLLVTRAARRLGNISYGIYLLQGLVLALVLRPAPLRAVALGSPWGHWGLILLCACVLVAMATATHVLIELPGIALGRRLAATRLVAGSFAAIGGRHPRLRSS